MYEFRTFMVPANLSAKAVAITDALGWRQRAWRLCDSALHGGADWAGGERVITRALRALADGIGRAECVAVRVAALEAGA